MATFDFSVLDDVALASERGRLPDQMPSLVARELGPIIEMANLAKQGLVPSPENAMWLSLDGIGPLYRAVSSGCREWISSEGKRIGVRRTQANGLDDETGWVGFCLAAQQAAMSTGFPRRVASQLAAAIEELRNNICEHSEAAVTGLVAYRATPGRFEFVTADGGIGVLKSLQTCPEFSTLKDHGKALELTLTEGVSRHGSNANRGYGFRPLFVGLANLSGTLRFRSGDHALVIDGAKPSLMTARLSQKPTLEGFLISVACETECR